MAGRVGATSGRRILAVMTTMAVVAGWTASFGAGTLAVQLATAGPAAAAYAGTWTPTYNQDFPDPSVMSYDGTLYAYSTETVAANIPGAQSNDAVNWSTVSTDIFPTLPSFAGGGMTWAPSVEQAPDGQFVMYYTALNPAQSDQCIGEATSASPIGPFVDANPGFVMCQDNLGGSIDPQIFEYPGGASLVWKSDGNSVKQPTHLWSEPLGPNLQLSGAAPSLLLTDDQKWQAGIVEGPNMVDENGTFYLFYGAAGYSTAAYSIGYATCAGPAGPCADHPDPILTSEPGEQGPGGPALFSYGGRLLMAFSAWPGLVGYPAGGYRAMYVASVGFDGSGVPHLTPYNLVPGQGGYVMAGSDGGTYSFGDAPDEGSLAGTPLNAPVVGLALTADDAGYWEASADGGVFGFGDASFEGSMGGQHLNQPIVGMAADPATGGYWLVAADGGIFSFDAPFLGSMGGQRLNAPVVGIEATADGGGYWLLTKDGGIFSFGDASFDGSMGGQHLNQPIVGMAADPATGGYWLVAADGGIFSFDAPFLGSMGSQPLNHPIVGMAGDATTGGYLLVAADGGVFSFDVPYLGSMGGRGVSAPIVAIAAANPADDSPTAPVAQPPSRWVPSA